MFSKVAKVLKSVAEVSSSRQCSTSSPLRHMVREAQSGKTAGVFAKIQVPIEPPPEVPNNVQTKSPWSKTLSVVGNVLFYGGLGIGGYFGVLSYLYDPEEIKSSIEKSKNSTFPGAGVWGGIMQFYLEKRLYIIDEIDKFSKPRQDTLLPDQIYPNKKTLVLDLDELLVHSDWTRERGWKVLKRPGLEIFLKELLPHFEIVVYSDQLFTYVEPVMDRVDPEKMIYRLHRTDTLYVNGKHVRDLSRLGREMSKVLMMSAKPDAWANHPENTLKLTPWKGDRGDTMLLDLIPFLKFAAQRVELDMRRLVDAYDGRDIPATFRARMQEMQEMSQHKASSSRGLFSSYLQR